MHSKRCYKIIYICSIILGGLKSFRNYKVFPEKLRCNLTFYESENFSDSFLHHIYNPKILGFLFLRKNSVSWVVKYEKLNFRKLLEIY